MRVLLVAFVLAAAAPATATAGTTGACHCYRDRTFDPARPAAADAYILATSRSSLLSAALGPSKRQLVQSAMSGTSPEDLWIAHWAAARSGADASALLDARGAGRPWKAILASAAGLEKTFQDALSRGASDADLAALAADDVLSSRAGVERETVAALRGQGASTSEVILSVVLARRLQTSPTTVLASAKAGNATWGALLQAVGVAPKDIDGLVRQSLSR
jgi:hypothetical protein